MQHALSRYTRPPKLTQGIPHPAPFIKVKPPVPHSHPRPHPQPSDSAASRSQWSRIYQTIFQIGWLLKRGKAEGAKEIFQSCLSKLPGPKYSVPRLVLYERGIAKFLNYEHFNGALEFHRKMNANRIFASHELRARLLVCSSIVETPHEQEQSLEGLFDELSYILSLPSYSQHSLCRLLDVLKRHPLVDSQFVSKLVDKHVDSRGSMGELGLNTINKLVLFYAHVGGIGAAESLVLEQDTSPVRQRHANPAPYTTLISSLVKRGALATNHINSLLNKVEQSKIRVDLPFFSVLVQRAVRMENYDQAFALYDTILQQEGPHMIPDSFVFGSLLNALQRIWTCRSPSIRRARCPPNAPTPRRFFRQMLECHLLVIKAANPRTPARRIIRLSTLNIALRLFMLCMDYPAAFVTLRTFDLLGLKPDLRSYRFVLTILSTRIQRTVLDADKLHWSHASWVANFLGGDNPSAEKALSGMGNTTSKRDTETEAETHSGEAKKMNLDIGINVKIARGLLEFGTMNSEYRAPTIEMIMGWEEVPSEKAKWDIEPLERLVAKAALASVAPKNARQEQAERALQKKMAPYFHEMVPEKLLIGRRLRESRV